MLQADAIRSASAGNAFNVPYATTKAGLVGCARSLRAELEGRP